MKRQTIASALGDKAALGPANIAPIGVVGYKGTLLGRVAHFVLVLLIPGLIALRVWQNWQAPQPWVEYKLTMTPRQWSVPEKIGHGIIRRVDDDSFWILVALTLASTRILSAWEETCGLSKKKSSAY